MAAPSNIHGSISAYPNTPEATLHASAVLRRLVSAVTALPPQRETSLYGLMRAGSLDVINTRWSGVWEFNPAGLLGRQMPEAPGPPRFKKPWLRARELNPVLRLMRPSNYRLS